MVVAVGPKLLDSILVMTPNAVLMFAGAMLLFSGIALTVAAQLGMGSSWRVGIDESARPGLVTGGLYQFCRNSIYLAMFLSQAGLLVMVPTWLSVIGCLGVWFCIRVQTLDEETYLLRTYGDEYRSYSAKVGRFLPGLGKL